MVTPVVGEGPTTSSCVKFRKEKKKWKEKNPEKEYMGSIFDEDGKMFICEVQWP
jgi:hypothetical protein